MPERDLQEPNPIGEPVTEHAIFVDLLPYVVLGLEAHKVEVAEKYSKQKPSPRTEGALAASTGEIDEMIEKVEAWLTDPSSLTLVRMRERDDGSSVLVLQDRTTRGELPTTYTDAIFQLKIYCNFNPEQGTSYDDEADSIAYRGGGRYKMATPAAGIVVDKSLSRAAGEGVIRFDAAYLYYDERIEALRTENGPGILFRLIRNSDVITNGVSYTGLTAEKTSKLLMPKIPTREQFEAIRSKITDPATILTLKRRAASSGSQL